MTAINDVTKLDVIESIGVLTLNSPPVNALSANVREGLDIGIKKAIENNPMYERIEQNTKKGKYVLFFIENVDLNFGPLDARIRKY